MAIYLCRWFCISVCCGCHLTSLFPAQPDSRPSLSLVPGVAALQRVREGATVDIRCVASDSDALITWARQDGKPLSSNARQINGETLR